MELPIPSSWESSLPTTTVGGQYGVGRHGSLDLGTYAYPDGTGTDGFLMIDTKAIQYPIGSSTHSQYGVSWRSYHVGGTHMLFCDGRVQYLSESTDLGLLKGLATRATGEVLGEY